MMLLRKKSLLPVLIILAFVALVSGVQLLAAAEQVEIAGTVFAAEWDAKDNVTAVVIATEEGEEIAVSNTGMGKELLNLEEKNVKATGSLVTDEEGRKTITITKYTIQE